MITLEIGNNLAGVLLALVVVLGVIGALRR